MKVKGKTVEFSKADIEMLDRALEGYMRRLYKNKNATGHEHARKFFGQKLDHAKCVRQALKTVEVIE